MKTKFFFVAMLVLALTGCDKLQTTQQVQVQRYQIVFNPNVRADTFMIDTQKGKVWQLTKFTDMTGQPTVWQEMEILDSTGEIGITFKRLMEIYPIAKK